jgi:hypothetical protein
MENKIKEQRFLSQDAITLMAMLPKGLTEEWQEKSFKVFARTKAELASTDILEALEATKMLNLHLYEEGTIGHKVYTQITDAINKATK